MLEWLSDFLSPALKPIKAASEPLVALIYTIQTLISFFTAAVKEFVEKHEGFFNAYNYAMQVIGAKGFDLLPTQIAQPMRFLNAFLPVTEMLVFCAATALAYAAAMVLRMLKTWIPFAWS